MKISIITATKNNKAGLLRAIESVRSQTYKNVEHIIVDGNSADGTKEILRQAQNYNANVILRPATAGRHTQHDKSLFSNHYSLITISEADSGIYDAINKGIKLATGDVIGLLHSDDFYANEFVLEKYAKAFEHNSINSWDSKSPKTNSSEENSSDDSDSQPSRIDAVYSDLVYLKKRKQIVSSENDNPESNNKLTPGTEYSVFRTWITHPKVKNRNSVNHSLITVRSLLNGWMPPHPTLFLRREVFEKYGLYRTDLKIAADYEMILRLFYKFKINAYYLPVITYCMPVGGVSNKSLNNIIQKSKEDLKALRIYSLSLPYLTLLKKNFRKLNQFFTK